MDNAAVISLDRHGCPQRFPAGINFEIIRERRQYENSRNRQFRAPALLARIGGRRPDIHVRVRHDRHDRRLCRRGRFAGPCAARPWPRRWRLGWRAVAVAGAVAAASAPPSASASAQPSSAVRSRRTPPSSSGAMPSTTACSAIVPTIRTAGPFWPTTAGAIPARSSGWLYDFQDPGHVPGFLFVVTAGRDSEFGGTIPPPQCCSRTPSITTVDAVLLPGMFESSQSRRSVPRSQTLRVIL